jgi:hypothetical protein
MKLFPAQKRWIDHIAIERGGKATAWDIAVGIEDKLAGEDRVFLSNI